MKRMIFLAAAAAAFAIPAALSTPAAAETVVIKRTTHDHGLRRGWDRGRHAGWRHREVRSTGSVTTKKVIRHHGDGTTTKKVIRRYD